MSLSKSMAQLLRDVVTYRGIEHYTAYVYPVEIHRYNAARELEALGVVTMRPNGSAFIVELVK